MQTVKETVAKLKDRIAPQKPDTTAKAIDADAAITEKFLGFVDEFKDSQPAFTDAQTSNDLTISKSDVLSLFENRRIMVSLLKDLRAADDLSMIKFYSKKLEGCLGNINFVIQKFQI
jgi:hypothetical protein